MGTLQHLAKSTYQRNFDHIFASIPIYDGSDREGLFLWLEHLEAACFYSRRNIKTEKIIYLIHNKQFEKRCGKMMIDH